MTFTRNVLKMLLFTAICSLLLVSGAIAGPQNAPKKIKAVMVGDRLVDVAYNLGYVPQGMAVRASLWSKSNELLGATDSLGCPNRAINKKPKSLINYMKKKGITRLIVEKNNGFCKYVKIDLAKAAALFKDVPGVKIEYVDFTKGTVPAIKQTAEVLGCLEKAQPLIEKYQKNMAKKEKKTPAKALGKRVVVLSGVYAAGTGKSFVRVEAPGGYSDEFFIKPLGYINAADAMIPKGAKVSKGHVMSPNLKGLAEANPDVIIMTGNAFAVQAALHKAVKRNPELAQITALKNNALYSLPFYADSGVIEYPLIFRQWVVALEE